MTVKGRDDTKTETRQDSDRKRLDKAGKCRDDT